MAEFLLQGRRWAVALLACPLLAGATQTIEHRVQPGDTLEALSIHYLGSAQLWHELQRRNQVQDPRRLQPGSVLQIPLDLLPRASAEVVFVHGEARIALPGAGQPEPARAGQQLPEGARAQAGPGSFISVRLADGTVVRVQADSEVLLEQLRRRGRAGDVQSLLELQRGAVEPSVTPATGPGRTLEIRTPTATTAVRGTRFVLSVAPDGGTLAAVTEGSVAVASRSGADTTPTLLPGGQGLAVSAEGRLAAPRPLLPAPDLEGLPAIFSDADFLNLRLAPVNGAAAYQVQVARDPQFHAVVRSSTSASAEVRLPALEDGPWHLAVRALDAEGLPGQLAQRAIAIKAHPLPPLYQSGTDDLPLPQGQALLRCTAVEGATRYRLQVSGSADFARPLLDETRAGECALDAPMLAPGSYHWRAASIRTLSDGQADQGPFGPAQPFAVVARPSSVASNAIDRMHATGLQLSWPSSAAGQRYRLQLAAEADFAEPIVDEELNSPTWSAPALAPGLYYVRIQTLDPSGLRSSFSTARRFRVAASVQDGSGQPVTASDGRPLSAP